METQVEIHRAGRVKAVRIGLVFLYSLAVIYFGTRHPSELPSNDVFTHDKVLHALAFGGLGVLAYRCGFGLLPERSRLQISVVAAAFATGLGALLEIIQAQLPYRSMEFADLVADFVGAVVLVALANRFSLERPLAGL